MRLRLRVFIVIALVAGLAAWQLYANFREQLKPALQQATEDVLVDTAGAFALLAEQDRRDGHLADGRLAAALRELARRPLNASIWGHERERSSVGVYVTDARGVVIFDSQGRREGLDYSRWNDVYLTLQGRYGARSTRDVAADRLSTVMYVGAPLRDDQGRISGVLTVFKPVQSLQPFLARGEAALSREALLVLVAALALGMVLAWWIARGIDRLVHWAEAVARGERRPLPDTGSRELDRLAGALGHMREELDGRRYIEDYVQALTHELKSPLAAIGASVELLQDDSLAVPERARFLAAIREQNQRAEELIGRLLQLVRVERLQGLEQPQVQDLVALWHEVAAAAAPRLQQRALALEESMPVAAPVAGDAFLLRLALGNLLANAIDFSPAGGRLECALRVAAGEVRFELRDHGQGVPGYALAQVFDRFYSLPRPHGGARSSGLGLPLVRAVATLHGGRVALDNHSQGGALATLVLPAA